MIERVLIVDDEPLARERLRQLVHEVAPTVTVLEVGDGDSAVARVRDKAPQAVFLDVQMPRRDGFDVIATVGTDAMPPVVFVTAYDVHAIRAFDTAAVDYLLKPYDDTRFRLAWQRLERVQATASLASEAQRLQALLQAIGNGAHARGEAERYVERFLVRIHDRTYPVLVRDVRWLQSDGNYVDLHTATGTHTVREPLSSVEARLDPARFVRIHRRVIVAIDQIRELQPWFAGDQVLILHDGTKLRVSRTRRAALASRLAGER